MRKVKYVTAGSENSSQCSFQFCLVATFGIAASDSRKRIFDIHNKDKRDTFNYKKMNYDSFYHEVWVSGYLIIFSSLYFYYYFLI